LGLLEIRPLKIVIMNHKDLDAWRKSISLVKKIYKLTENMPDSEKFSLTNQMRRSAVSISSNIAEGSARESDKEFIQFLYYSMGSIAELETQLIISQELGFINISKEVEEDLLRTRQIIIGLIRYLKSKKK
jgi:four helix bundle protein